MKDHPRFCRILAHPIWSWTNAPLSDAIFVSFRTQTSLSYNSSSLIAHRLPKLCLRGRWWLWKGIPGKYVVFIDFFYWNVQLSPVQFYQMPKFLLFPHPSTLRRGEGLCKFIGGSSSLRGLWGFSHFKRPENKSKWRMVENIRLLKKLLPWPIPCLLQSLLLKPNSLNRVSKGSESQDPGFEWNIARDFGERKISWQDKGFDRYSASIPQICTGCGI